jgi:nucleoside 2-deoxyribosyltransferase
VGLYPLDNVIDTRLPPRQRACAIAQANMGMIRSAHGVIANLQAFRGAEPDSGTVFEVGMAVALGKPVWAVFPDRGDLRTQVPSNEHGFCQQGWLVEDFGLPRNLMLACTWAGHSATVEEAVAGMAELLSGQ